MILDCHIVAKTVLLGINGLKCVQAIEHSLKELLLKQSVTIRKFISLFLFVVFAISVAPKAYFHDAFANHKDSGQVCTDNNKAAHLHQSGINCGFDQLVVSCLYYFEVEPATDIPVSFFCTPHQRIGTIFFFQPSFSSESRGPPYHVSQ